MKQVGRKVLLCGTLKTRSSSMRGRSQQGHRLPLVGEVLSALRLDNTSLVQHEGTALAPCTPKGKRARQIREGSAGKGRKARQHYA